MGSLSARKVLKMLVGAEGFEPPALCSQSRCATRLRYAPTVLFDCIVNRIRAALTRAYMAHLKCGQVFMRAEAGRFGWPHSLLQSKGNVAAIVQRQNA